MKRNVIFLVIFVIANIIVVVGGQYWKAAVKENAETLLRNANRYTGATGPAIKAFDERTDRWIEEMKAEPMNVILKNLSDAKEYDLHASRGSEFGVLFRTDEERERYFFCRDIEIILSNRRFRKAYEDLLHGDKQQAVQLIKNNITEHLKELHKELQYDKNTIEKGEHTANIAIVTSIPDEKSYRHKSSSNHPPTRTGRKYAVLSYVLLASLFELREVRPEVEAVIAFAKKEYQIFNSVDDEAHAFKWFVLSQSLYNPSLLLTATLCDPDWNKEQHEKLKAKFISDREVVDYQARAIEHDKDAKDGWIPVVKHDKMLKIRYYKGITDEEFNAFFAE